jgi:prepilin-type N-terminal cleavage/methylation domain-containing protein
MEPKLFRNRRQGFTLVELLVVIVIIAVLAVLSVVGAAKFMEKGRKVQALAQFRDLASGIQAYSVDYQRGPIPREKRDAGRDVVFGDVGGDYSNDFIVAALYGDSNALQGFGNKYSQEELNPKKESYLILPLTADKKNGMGLDAILYDPWGKPLIIAINTPPFRSDTAEGEYDKQMWTYGVGEYTDSRPREQDYVFWSFGKDGKKGKGAAKTDIVPFGSSDDVTSWQ